MWIPEVGATHSEARGCACDKDSHRVSPEGASILKAQGREGLFSLEERKPQTESPAQMLIQAKCKLVIEPMPPKFLSPRARESKTPYSFCKLIVISKEPVK